jgi:hypothetical protein
MKVLKSLELKTYPRAFILGVFVFGMLSGMRGHNTLPKYFSLHLAVLSIQKTEFYTYQRKSTGLLK